jgi:hypothetical protein
MNPKTFYKKIFSKKPKISSPGRAVAWPPYERDWQLLLTSFLVITAIIFAVHLYLFMTVNNGDLLSATQPPQMSPQAFDQSRLTATISFFEVKAARARALASSTPLLVDPSL